MTGPPPLLRDDRLSLELLGRMAREFDQLSSEDGRTWPATDFVRWLREYRATSEANVTGAERREAARSGSNAGSNSGEQSRPAKAA
jgi:hypothetical protein